MSPGSEPSPRSMVQIVARTVTWLTPAPPQLSALLTAAPCAVRVDARQAVQLPGGASAKRQPWLTNELLNSSVGCAHVGSKRISNASPRSSCRLTACSVHSTM
jgi:hypothetical protein